MNSTEVRCDICGEPAVCQVQDIEEDEPCLCDRSRKKLACWKTHGPIRSFCAAHQRLPQQHMKDGKVVDSGPPPGFEAMMMAMKKFGVSATIF